MEITIAERIDEDQKELAKRYMVRSIIFKKRREQQCQEEIIARKDDGTKEMEIEIEDLEIFENVAYVMALQACAWVGKTLSDFDHAAFIIERKPAVMGQK